MLKIRQERFGLIARGFGLAALYGAALIGCTENTAGVISETESGQQANVNEDGEKVVNVSDCSSTTPSSLAKRVADVFETNCITFDRDYAMTDVQGTVVDKNGVPVKSARVLLKRIEQGYSVSGAKHETTTDENGNYTFKDVVYKVTYKNIDPIEVVDFTLNKKGQADIYYDFTLQAESEDKSIASYATLDLMNAEKVTKNKSVIRKVESQKLRSTASAEIAVDPQFFSDGEQVCLDYSFTCHVLTEEDIAKGSFVMEDIPEGAYQSLCRNSASEEEGKTTMKCQTLAKPVIASETSEPTSIDLPEEAILLLDSLKDKSLPAVILPAGISLEGAGKLLVSDNSVSKQTAIDASNGRYWVEVSFDSSSTNYSLADGSGVGIDSRILYTAAHVQNDSILKKHDYLQKANVGYSFKFALDGSDKTLTEPLFSTVETFYDNRLEGIEITQCEARSKSFCLRVYNYGEQSDSTEIALESKSILLDGESHQISFALAGNHLTIVVDGKVTRDTDLKLRDYFGSYSNYRDFIQVGDAELQDFVVFRMNSDIHQDKDAGWNRLKAWLLTHQSTNLKF